MSSTTTNPKIKLLGVFIILVSVLMIVAGGVTWALVSSQLKAENITVSAVTDEDPGPLAGKPVAGPFTAYAQANAINHHALEGAGGRTYAQIGADAKVLKEKLAKDGLSKSEVDANPDVIALAATRTQAMNGSFLRASLFTSVVAYGVAALVMGLGVLFALVGLALMSLSKGTTAATARHSERAEQKAAVKV